MLSSRAKIGVGLQSGKYSQKRSDDEEPSGISPGMFKILVGRGHPDFSTKRQQDAQEFFLHIVNLLERNSKNQNNPSDAFKFKVEERVQCCSTKKVKYSHRSDMILALNIALDAAVNKEEVNKRDIGEVTFLNVFKREYNRFCLFDYRFVPTKQDGSRLNPKGKNSTPNHSCDRTLNYSLAWKCSQRRSWWNSSSARR